VSAESKTPRILFAAGGTGGHLFPAIAIAEEILKIRQDAKIAFVGTKNKIEARVVPQKGFGFYTIWISGFHRRLTIDNLLFPVKIVVSLIQSFFLIRRYKPDIVVGTGGYVCGPILFAADLTGIPTVIHESNSYPGITTRLLASKASKVLISFEATKQWMKINPEKMELVGNPTRDQLGSINRETGLSFFGLKPKKKTLLVVGGSLGASSINETVFAAAGEIAKADIQLIWQTGEFDYEKVKSKTIHGQIWIGKFIDEMAYAYAAADMVLCRSGATTIAELTRLGIPAILVPYPHAAANHQELNANSMVKAGAATIIRDSELKTRALSEITRVMSDDHLRMTMGEHSKKIGKPNAGKDIAVKVLGAIGFAP
jgi:UDP-N-acetylglucosamine--N-acetylmuramyl-(pentapeptide) pyrophosphoryl-undecaprenol N-acetylglucosamine transferase